MAITQPKEDYFMIQILNASVEDAAAIQQLLRETWKDTYGDHLSQETLDEVYQNWQSIDLLSRQIGSPQVYFPLAKEGDELLGLSTTRLHEDTIMMFRLYVSPQHQRKGIGDLLLNNVIEHFQGATKIQLSVEAMNPKGQSFYKKQAFKEIKRAEEKIGNEVIEVIVMEKAL
jgi:ribosomal protein S18 acetylase RimI-like enzyme